MAGLMLWYASCVIAVESPPTEPVTVISELVGAARSTWCSPAVVIVSESRGSAQTIIIEATMPSAISSSRNQCCRQRPAARATPEARGLKPGRTCRLFHAPFAPGATSVSVVVALLIRSLPPTVVALLENILHHGTDQPAVPCFCALLPARQRSCVWLPVMSSYENRYPMSFKFSLLITKLLSSTGIFFIWLQTGVHVSSLYHLCYNR